MLPKVVASGVSRDPSSWLELSELGPAAPYKATYKFDGDYIDANHAKIAGAPTGRFQNPILIDLGINGYLLRADALKLYELAYFSEGDILELGTHRGLSTSIIASALHAKGSGHLTTVDLDWRSRFLAAKNLRGRPGANLVRYIYGDAAKVMDKLTNEGKKFGFIFVDHWHGYDATKQAAERCKKLLAPGGFVLFHDYADKSNADPEHVYGVYQAVHDEFVVDKRFEFYCISGCCGLFRFTDQPDPVTASSND